MKEKSIMEQVVDLFPQSAIVAMVIVALVAVYASYTSLVGFALWCGFEPISAWLFPILVDGFELASLIFYVKETTSASNKYADMATAYIILALSMSIAFNAIGHINIIGSNWTYGQLIGSVIPPVVLGLLSLPLKCILKDTIVKTKREFKIAIRKEAEEAYKSVYKGCTPADKAKMTKLGMDKWMKNYLVEVYGGE